MDQKQPTYYSPFLSPVNIRFHTKDDVNLHPVLDTGDDGVILLKAPRELSIGGLKTYEIDTGLSIEIPVLHTIQTAEGKWQSTLDIIGELYPLPDYIRDYQLEITYPRVISRTRHAQDLVLHLMNRGTGSFKIPQYSVFACIRFIYVPKLHVELSLEESHERVNRH